MDKEILEKNLWNLEHFFTSDIRIKNDLIKLAPSEEYNYKETNRLEYVDKLYQFLKDTEDDLVIIMKDFFPNEVYAIKEKFKIYYEKLLLCRTNYQELTKFYHTYLTNMEHKTIEYIKNNTTYLNNSIYSLVLKCNTINELLHAIHSSIINSEHIMESLPQIATKNNYESYPITLRGTNNLLSKLVYDTFPIDLSCGWTDIVGLNNKVLLMIRDLGHAMTIEITNQDKENLQITYHIPKICNPEKVNLLPGVSKVPLDANIYSATNGQFNISKMNFRQAFPYFLSLVPTDSDIILDDTPTITK